MTRAAVARLLGRLLLAFVLAYAGVAHFRLDHAFLGQVPTWFPARLLIVHVSGVMELVMATTLLLVPRGRPRVWLGIVVAAFFVAVFPGNVDQMVTGSHSFGLDSTAARVVRLFFQPPLVLWALWCTGALGFLRSRYAGPRARR